MNINRLVIVSANLALFRFQCNFWFTSHGIIVALFLSVVLIFLFIKHWIFFIIFRTLLTIYWWMPVMLGVVKYWLNIIQIIELKSGLFLLLDILFSVFWSHCNINDLILFYFSFSYIYFCLLAVIFLIDWLIDRSIDWLKLWFVIMSLVSSTYYI